MERGEEGGELAGASERLTRGPWKQNIDPLPPPPPPTTSPFLPLHVLTVSASTFSVVFTFSGPLGTSPVISTAFLKSLMF